MATAAAEKRRADRRDANLLARFPDEAAHYKARQAELAPLLASLRQTEARIAQLSVERKRLEEEKEFYSRR